LLLGSRAALSAVASVGVVASEAPPARLAVLNDKARALDAPTTDHDGAATLEPAF
jgi:hypothetical protein